MNKIKSTFYEIFTREETLIFLVFFLSGLSLYGWFSGHFGLASFSLKYKPISPIIAISFIIVSILMITDINLKKSRSPILLVKVITIILAFYFCAVFLDYIFNFTWDVEGIFIKNLEKFGIATTSHMSPIASLLFISICISILSSSQNISIPIKYIGGSLAMIVFLTSFVLNIGYLYNAPLLYGSKIIPVALPATICFMLFSIVLFRIYDLKFWTFNQIGDNKTIHILLKSFLPIVILIVILEGFRNNVLAVNNANPTLISALIILIVVSLTVFIVFRISKIVGAQLLKAEQELRQSEKDLKDRNKELYGIYSLGLLAEKHTEKENIYNDLVNTIVPNSMQFPEKVYVSLEIDSKIYSNIANFKLSKTQIYLFAPIIVLGEKTGELVVAYTENIPFIDFFEHQLIDSYAERISNITERIDTRKALEESEKLLIQLNVDKDRFISILGHDLKNPFNNILGLSEVLTDGISSLTTDEIEDIAKDINKSVKITSNLLEDILMWARTQHGSIPFKPQNLSLSATYENVLIILNPSAYAKNITIYDSSLDHINVYADADMLKTILLNLVSNAIKFTNNGGKITINAEQNSENVIIQVSDNGVGISSAILVNLFDISKVISSQGTAEETGTGLGLLICKEFVEKHQGEIWVESEVGKGSVFKFSLPLSVMQASAINK
jgi:signal transduction histidine kinase